MKIRAKLKPLKGKYYGTKITLDFGGYEEEIELWDSAYFIPSERELNRDGFSKKEYEENIFVEDGWGGKQSIQELLAPCDSHFESQTTYERAIEIIKRINK